MNKPVTILVPELFTPKPRPHGPGKHDKYLRENHFLDSAILADELGVTEYFVWKRLRKLGFRKCTSTAERRQLGLRSD